MSRSNLKFALWALCLLTGGTVQAQTPTKPSAPTPPATRRTLKPEDYGQWESLAAPQISNDGHWIIYQLPKVSGDTRLIVKNSDTPQKVEVPNAAMAAFSDDSKWCAYLIGPSKVEADRLREEKKPIITKVELINLATSARLTFEAIQSFRFTKGSLALIMSAYRGPTKGEGGSDMAVLNLATGENLTLGNVTQASTNDTGDLLAVTIHSDSGQKGVQLLDLKTSRLRTLAWGKSSVTNVTWASKSDVIGFLVGTTDEKKEGDSNVVLIGSDLKSEHPRLAVFDPTKAAGFPQGFRIAEYGGFVLNDDGSAVGFGVVEWKDKKKPEGKPQDKPGVEVWNTKDIRVIPEQRVQAGRDKLKSGLAVWRPTTNIFQRISDGKAESTVLIGNFERAMIVDPTPYQSPVTNGISYHDVLLVDTTTGHRTKVLEHTQWMPVPSRKGKYFAYFERKNWWLYDITTDKKISMTGGIKSSFEDIDDDHTVPEKPPVGGPAWLANDDGLILNDKYDCYLYRTGVNSVTPLTDGRKDRQVYRLLDPERAEDGLSLQNPFFFSIFDEREKASGFYRADNKGKGKVLVLDNVQFANLVKSKNTDRVLFSYGSFEKAPNLFLTNTDMAQSKLEGRTNPQQANFLWGKTQLVKYKSRWGKELQGSLIYPADYVKGRSYPMVTLIYERESDNLHAYMMPIDWSPYNPQVLSQNGYFVFMPDIAYRPRNPGKSAVDCLEPALEAVFALKVGVDSTKVGLMGHSWGGYETAFVTTVSKMFAVGIAGAPLTELTSMYNSYFWNGGMTDQVLFETSQGRMEVPFWEDPKVYFENSAVWQSAKRTSPILITFGDQDGAVDWHQGQYLYNTLRRMGKNAVLLVYAGENHGLAKRANQLDYSHRLRHFLDVYLKNAKPEPWVNDGVPLLKQLDN